MGSTVEASDHDCTPEPQGPRSHPRVGPGYAEEGLTPQDLATWTGASQRNGARSPESAAWREKATTGGRFERNAPA